MNPPDRDGTLEVLRNRVDERVFAHCLRVEETAVMLAETYGVDVASARLAGLLHDWSKSVPDPMLLVQAAELRVAVQDADQHRPSLLHGPVGAADLAITWPGLDPQIIVAIARHTYGAPDMTPLDMVVYIADTIEPSRHFDGVQELRDAVGMVPLRELYVRTYAGTIKHLLDTRSAIHPATVANWNHAIAQAVT